MMVRPTLPAEVVPLGDVSFDVGTIGVLVFPSLGSDFRVVVAVRILSGPVVSVALDRDGFEALKRLIETAEVASREHLAATGVE